MRMSPDRGVRVRCTLCGTVARRVRGEHGYTPCSKCGEPVTRIPRKLTVGRSMGIRR